MTWHIIHDLLTNHRPCQTSALVWHSLWLVKTNHMICQVITSIVSPLLTVPAFEPTSVDTHYVQLITYYTNHCIDVLYTTICLAVSLLVCNCALTCLKLLCFVYIITDGIIKYFTKCIQYYFKINILDLKN